MTNENKCVSALIRQRIDGTVIRITLIHYRVDERVIRIIMSRIIFLCYCVDVVLIPHGIALTTCLHGRYSLPWGYHEFHEETSYQTG